MTLTQTIQKARIKQCLRQIEAELDEFAKECSQERPQLKWESVRFCVPPDGERVVVKTKDGATYFSSATNGKFFDNITHWFRLPNE